MSPSKPELLPIHLPDPPGEEAEGEETRKGWFSNVYLVAVVLFSVCLVKLYIDQYIEIRRLAKEVRTSEAQLQETRREYEKLAEEVEYLETLEGVERLARDKLRYIRPDEVILIPLRPGPG